MRENDKRTRTATNRNEKEGGSLLLIGVPNAFRRSADEAGKCAINIRMNTILYIAVTSFI